MKRTSRLTALVMVLLMLVNISASATTTGIPLGELDIYDFEAMTADAMDAAEGGPVLSEPCSETNQYCALVTSLVALPTAQERYDFMMGLYSEDETDTTLEGTMLHYYYYKAEHNAEGLICECDFPSLAPEYQPGTLSIHEADCPWTFANLSVAEQYTVYKKLATSARPAYMASLDETQVADLEDYILSQNSSEICDGVECGFDAFAAMSGADRHNKLIEWIGTEAAEMDTMYNVFINHVLEKHISENAVCVCYDYQNNYANLGYGSLNHVNGVDWNFKPIDCPWHFSKLPSEDKITVFGQMSKADQLVAFGMLTVAEQYKVLGTVDAEQKAELENKYPEATGKLENVNKTEQTVTSNGNSEDEPSTDVAIKVPQDAFDVDYIMNATASVLNTAQQAALDALQAMHQLAVFDISFEALTNGDKLQPKVPVELTFTIDTSKVVGNTLHVHHLKDDGDGTYKAESLGTVTVDKSLSTQTVPVTCPSFSAIVFSSDCTGGTENGGCGFDDFAKMNGWDRESTLLTITQNGQFQDFMHCVLANHSDIANINKLICLCASYEFAPTNYHYGDLNHDSSCMEFGDNAAFGVPCPWHFGQIPPEDQLIVFETMDAEDKKTAFPMMGVENQATVLEPMDDTARETYLGTLNDDQKAALEEYMNANTDRTLPTDNGSISGKIPADVVAVMDSTTVVQAVVDALVPADAFVEGTMTTKAYDMKLKDANGNAWMPTEPVTVQVNGIVDASWEEPLVAVIHLLDSAEAIAKESNVYTTDDPAIVSAFPDEVAAALAAGLGNVVAFIGMTSEDCVTINDDGSISFQTNSFSDYYVSAGLANASITGENYTELGNGDNHTFYVEPGTTFRFAYNVEWWGTQYVNNLEYATGSSGAEAYFTTANGYQVIVAENAPEDATVTYTATWGWNNSATLKFVVKDRSYIVNNTFNNNAYPVILSLLGNVNEIPAEPGTTNSTDYYHITKVSDTEYRGQSGRITFADTANGIVKPEIKDALIRAADGTAVLGVYDASGVNTKNYLDNINWTLVLDVIANTGAYDATDGVRVVNSNKSKYEVIPYVVKLMTVRDAGWHIDCVLVPKSNKTVSYDLNLKNYVAEGITLPSAQSDLPPFNHTVGRISGLKTINNQSNSVSATLNGESYTLRFLGWSTDPNATEPTYQPGNTIPVEDNTVLYAIWSGTPDPGTLEIKKTVQSNGGVQAPSDDEFTFKVVFNGAGSLNYQIMNADGTVGTTGTIASTGTLKLKAGQTATINNVPVGAYTVTEEGKANYTTTSTGASGNIVANETSTASFVNTYTKPTSNLKITKQLAEGSATDHLNHKFTFEVTLPADTYQYQIGSGDVQELQIAEGGTGTITLAAGETATIKDIDIGNAYTIQENDLLGYEVTSIIGAATNDVSAKKAEGTIAAADSEVVFTNTYKTGNLSIEKTVNGVCAPADAEFTFTIAVDGNIAGTYSAVKNSVTENVIFTYDTATDKSTASVTLKHGEKIEIQKLPKNAEYTVTEVYESADYQCVSTNASGTISDTVVSAASFVNTYLRGELTIVKQLASGTTAEAGQMFLFTVTGPEFSEPLTITLAPGGQVTLTDLKLGTYTVTEDTEWAGRYQPDDTRKSSTLTIEQLTDSITFTNTKKNDQWLDANAVVTNRFEKVLAEETQE